MPSFKELSLPIFPVHGGDVFSITHVLVDDRKGNGDIVAGFGEQIEGDPHGTCVPGIILGLSDKEVEVARKLIK